MPQRLPRKRTVRRAPRAEPAGRPRTEKVWAVDFQVDATTDGRPIQIVSIADEDTRECLGGLVERNHR